MPRPGIPPALEPAVLEQAGLGRSHREIAAWLKATHKVGVTHVTVGKVLKRIRVAVGESTRAVAVSEVAPKVVQHIAALGEIAEAAKAIRLAATPGLDEKGKAKKADPHVALKALEVERKTRMDALKVGGADGGDEKAATLAELLAGALE